MAKQAAAQAVITAETARKSASQPFAPARELMRQPRKPAPGSSVAQRAAAGAAWPILSATSCFSGSAERLVSSAARVRKKSGSAVKAKGSATYTVRMAVPSTQTRAR